MNFNLTSIITWALCILAAVIMLQTLYFKFTASEESVFIFTTLGMEPWGLISTGIMELIASILILFPPTTGIGSLLGMGLMSGAIFFHLTKLGIVVKDDGGQLFIYAVLVFISCFALIMLHQKSLLNLSKSILKK